MKFVNSGKKGEEGTSSLGHLGGWIIAIAVLILIIMVALSAFGMIKIDFLRNLRFG